MKNVIGVEYLLRRNLGNYEHEELKIIDVVDKEDSVNGLKSVMSFVRDAIYGEGEFFEGGKSPKKTEAVDKKPLVEPAIRKTSPDVSSAKAEASKPEAVKPEVKPEVKTEAKPEVKTETKPEVKPEEKAEAKPEEKPKTPATRKPETSVKVDKSVTVYDRTHQPHKTLIGQYLDKNFPTWKTGSSIDKAVAASHAMNGKAMLDKEGNFLSEFTEEFNKLMA